MLGAPAPEPRLDELSASKRLEWCGVGALTCGPRRVVSLDAYLSGFVLEAPVGNPKPPRTFHVAQCTLQAWAPMAAWSLPHLMKAHACCSSAATF
jgi:hypothetical protein